MVTHLWQRMQTDYLNELQQRTKWLQTYEDLKEDTLVLIHDESPPCNWKLGRIIGINTGTDGHVRVATIKTSTGILTRAITKIAPLPLENLS